MTPLHTASPRVLTINFFAHRICEKISFMVLISSILELKRIQVSFIGVRSNVFSSLFMYGSSFYCITEDVPNFGIC